MSSWTGSSNGPERSADIAALGGAADRGTAAPVHVVATTMSGSLQDQRKVAAIGPAFAARTDREVFVHRADSHAEARNITSAVVADGARLLISAGGAGTFNAVLDGAHADGVVPADLRLGFLRKGSADLIGKALGIPDELESAVETLMTGIEADIRLHADILAVEVEANHDDRCRKPLVGFGGVGVFGEVPRFTESRFVKLYKGVLGSLFGDYGPFYVGLVLALVAWFTEYALGRVPEMTLVVDGEEFGPDTWASVIVVNGDLGPAFPLGSGLALGSGVFRVVALRYRGLAGTVRQFAAARSGALLDDPALFGSEVREARCLRVVPGSDSDYLVNVDGVRLTASGSTTILVSGSVSLICAYR